jgi:hypothetical protein
MYGVAVIPQNAAAGQIYAPMRLFVPITSANFPDCNSLSISTPIRYALHPFSVHLPRHHPVRVLPLQLLLLVLLLVIPLVLALPFVIP